MRSTAKWTLAIVGAVGGVLISGGPLIAIGQVNGLLDPFLAGFGLALALAGIGLAIWFTSRVLLPRLVTPAVFREQRTSITFTKEPWFLATKRSVKLARLTASVDKEAPYFFDTVATSVEDLLARQAKTLDGISTLTDALAAGPPAAEAAVLQLQLDQLRADATRINACFRELLPLGYARLVEQDLLSSRLCTLVGGVLVVAGAALFFSATASSAPMYVPVLTPQVTSVPSVTATPSATGSASGTPTPSATH